MKYLGPHEAMLETLPEHVRGEIYRTTGERRRSYRGQSVIDMSLIRMHYARNEISDRSFKCLDLTFFQIDSNKRHYDPHEQEEESKDAKPAAKRDETKHEA